MSKKPSNILKLIGPGILIAATGVGAGDLATAAFTGSRLGVTILWAVLVGAFLKFVLTEGLARWQLATGETLLEGVCHRYGKVIDYLFLAYLLVWTLFVSVALMSACGVAMHAILPLRSLVPVEPFPSLSEIRPWLGPSTDKVVYGILHSGIAVGLVLWGGYQLFEKVMGVCIGVMFLTVVSAAILIGPDWGAVFQGLFIPSLEVLKDGGLGWTVALMGGVGGTLTVVCYGYWIREEGRTGAEDVRLCRIDLATGYAVTAIFGLGMVILGSQLPFDKGAGGATLVVKLAEVLKETKLGSTGQWAFLLGAWGAVFSSLLGVWQCVPYLFADFLSITKRDTDVKHEPVTVNSPGYKPYLFAMATIPIVGLLVTEFRALQKFNAMFGALVMPMLAATLLMLNNRKQWVGERFRNKWYTNVVLVLTLVFFLG
ncbi:MAG: Nramp family divalent metal transporter, partial [Planctomycetaceae bacterium]|nr:Nramp family divalent metal transporter [Planctomycetaceae bacterium]